MSDMTEDEQMKKVWAIGCPFMPGYLVDEDGQEEWYGLLDEHTEMENADMVELYTGKYKNRDYNMDELIQNAITKKQKYIPCTVFNELPMLESVDNEYNNDESEEVKSEEYKQYRYLYKKEHDTNQSVEEDKI